jgi:hypothetical protein
MMNFLIAPFVATGILGMASLLRRAFSHMKAPSMGKVKSGWVSYYASVLIVCIVLTSQATLAIYQAYPHEEIMKVQPAAYEIDAVRYINSDTNGSYVVLGDSNLASVAMGFLGSEYGYGGGSRGLFGLPEWESWPISLYLQMVSSPSISIMKEALSRAHASVSYFVVSIREPTFEEIVRNTKEVLPVTQIFGDGKLYIFAYPSSITRGVGPRVNVTVDGGVSMSIPTEFAYVAKSEVSYNLTVSGHSSYNVTNYPSNWAFQSSLVNGTFTMPDSSSDVNSFVQFSGLNPVDVLTVTWEANDLYPIVGWKEDSFKSGWQTHPLYPGTISPDVAVSSNVLSLTWNFVVRPPPDSYQYYYYIKRVSFSTNDYPYVIVKWRSNGPIAAIGVSYASGEGIINPVVPYNSQSSGWILSTLRLDPNETTSYVMVGITNVGSQQTIAGLYTLYVDYILICAKASLP